MLLRKLFRERKWMKALLKATVLGVLGCSLVIIVVFALFVIRTTNSIVPKQATEKYLASLEDHYTIVLGEDKFKIPVEYLLDDRARKDGEQIDPLRERVVGPIIFFQPPDMKPVENARMYRRYPYGLEGSVRFSIDFLADKSANSSVERLLEIMEKRKAETGLARINIPDFTALEDGVHAIGQNQLQYVREDYEDLFLYVVNHVPVGYLTCTNAKFGPVPGCWAYLQHGESETISFTFNFRLPYFEWFADEGFEKSIDLVESWHRATLEEEEE